MPHAFQAVQQLRKMLQNLDRWLLKAEEHAASKGFDPNVLAQARLAPDMFPLTRQVGSACDGAKFLAGRLSGSKDIPRHPDTEQTMAELRARIASVLQYLAGLKQSDFAQAGSQVVPLGFMPGKALAGDDYLHEMSLPNTYFHLAMAYAILRHNGVPLAKEDFLGTLRLHEL